MKPAVWIVRAFLLLALFAAAAPAAHAELGIVGGLAALSGCMNVCPETHRGTESECMQFCRCSLTVESRELKTEMALAEILARHKRCQAFVWPDQYVAPGLEHAPKVVIVCTPLTTDAFGNFTPDAKKAQKDGRNDKHWRDVDSQLTKLKTVEKARLLALAVQARRFVTVVLADYNTPTKLRNIDVDANCPSRHRSQQVDFGKWMSRPGLGTD